MINNPARHDSNKEIDIVKFIPDYLKGDEVETFLQLFETYLNELYEGTSTYVDPSLLSDITWSGNLIYTNNSTYVYARDGEFTEYFKSGDYLAPLEVSTSPSYYNIYNIINDEVIELTEPYTNNYSSSATAYYDNFNRSDYGDFWDVGTVECPSGMDDNLKNYYTLDTVNERIIFDIESASGTQLHNTIADSISGDIYSLEFGMHLSNGTNRSNEFGVILADNAENISATDTYIQVLYNNDTISLNVSGTTSASFPLDEDIDDFTLIITKDDSNLTFQLRGADCSDITANTWSTNVDGVSGNADVGYHNRWTYSISASPDDASRVFKLGTKNGYKQGFNYMFFKAKHGFRGYIFSA